MGGTSTDISLVYDGELKTTKEWYIEYGYPIGFQSIEIMTIGAGGGPELDLYEVLENETVKEREYIRRNRIDWLHEDVNVVHELYKKGEIED